MVGFGQRWGREKLPGLWDPPAMRLSYPPTSEEGAPLVFSVAPTVYHKAPSKDSDDTGSSLRWLEPPTSWVVTLLSGGQGGRSMFLPASPKKQGSTSGVKSVAPFMAWKLLAPVTFMNEGGPCL